MELILWRHAEAEDSNSKGDGARRLTKKGRKQAERMAAWLRPLIDDDWRILVGPAERAVETVKPLDRRYELSEEVGTGAGPRGILEAVGWPDDGRNCVVVGHQPTLGEVAARLLGVPDSELAIRKGAIWWFVTRSRTGGGETILKAVLNPDLLEEREKGGK